MNSYVKNALGRDIPTYIAGIGKLEPFKGAYNHQPQSNSACAKIVKNFSGDSKLLASLKASLEKCEIADGMTISFHHHFRNGDFLVNLVVDEIAKMGVKDITICASSLQSIHEPLIKHIKNGVITGIQTSGMRGRLGEAITKDNILKKPIIIRSHGGRPRAIIAGEVKIDIAFLAAPAADEYGNINGVMGTTACGSLGYAMVDAEYAAKVVVVTDTLVDFPATPISIPQTLVDYVVVMDSIGDPSGIVSGATRSVRNPLELLIAKEAAKVVFASGLVREGFSFQAGSGGASLAVAYYLKQKMIQEGIIGSFVSGGGNNFIVEMLNMGLFKTLFDVQCFDLTAVESIKSNPNHIEMSADFYANPHNKGCLVNKLDIMILSATEIDLDFNVNVITGSNGIIMGASGGHSDTAAGAKLSVVVAPLLRGRLPIIVDEVMTVVTPGETIDVVVTERGIAINPKREDLRRKFEAAKLDVLTIEELKNMAERLSGKPERIRRSDDIVGIVEYRDGTIIDTIRRVMGS